MSYFKIFAFSVCFSLLFLSVFVMVAFDSENTLSKAYEHFANKEYYESRYLLINEDNPIPLADFYLYEAYLAREELGLKKSQGYLLQSIQELSTKKSSTALEINLNLALNAFLLNDLPALQNAINQSIELSSSDELWIPFFKGCLAYIEEDYDQTKVFWDSCKDRRWLSNWMKTSFERHLSIEKIDLMYLHAELETEHISSTRKKLEQCLSTWPEYCADIQFLLALSYVKEGDTIDYSTRRKNYQTSIELLQKIPPSNDFFVKKRNDLLATYKQEILHAISYGYFSDLSLYVKVLQNWQALDQLQTLSMDLVDILNEKIIANNRVEAAKLLQNLSRSIPDGALKQFFVTNLSKKIYNALNKENLQHLDDYISLTQNYLSDPALSVLADATTSKILELVENASSDLTAIRPYISFWNTFEKNEHNRYLFARQLVQKAQRLWSFDGESQKAFNLIKIAQFLPSSPDKNLILGDIELAVLKTYRQAIHLDQIHELPRILLAAREFGVLEDEISDPQELANQLADAEYLLGIGRYSLASAKACWVLQLEPNNETAKKIVALAAYEEGRYQEANEHFKNLNIIDPSMGLCFMVSKVLSNDSPNQQDLIEELTRTPLSSDPVLRLAFGYLTLSQPEQSIFWFNKLPIMNDEILTGFCIASFQKQDWKNTIDFFNKLSNEYCQIPAVQGMVIQALIAQNENKKAHEIFEKFVLSFESYLPNENNSKPFVLFQNYLKNFDAHNFAARYYLHVERDAENALRQFREIKKITPELLVERAELAYSLKYFSESIDDLQLSLQQSEGSLREKALTLLNSIYLQIYTSK